MDSICKCEGGFKQKHLSWSITVSPHISKCSGEKLLEWSSWWGWQDVVTGWLHGGLCVKRPGLPHARYSCFQPAPMDTPQSRAEHLTQDGDTAKKMHWRKSMTNSRKNNKVSEKKRRKWCFRHQSRFPWSPWKGPHWSTWIFPDRNTSSWRACTGAGLSWNIAAHGKAHWRQVKVWGGVEEGSGYGLTVTPVPHLPCTTWGRL